MLLRENGLFLADDRVIPLLPKLLGKAFFNAKKSVALFVIAAPLLMYIIQGNRFPSV